MKHPVALITGIAGFAGSFLAEDLLSHGWKVHGTTLPGESKEKISHLKKDLHLSPLFERLDSADKVPMAA